MSDIGFGENFDEVLFFGLVMLLYVLEISIILLYNLIRVQFQKKKFALGKTLLGLLAGLIFASSFLTSNADPSELVMRIILACYSIYFIFITGYAFYENRVTPRKVENSD